MLFVTHTTLSVPALTGAIMCMGVATANSILVVSFARERLAEGADAATAAIDAGFTRFRPVLMTALAMIIGMGPMALSAELNAPLGRAVIGGLVFATVATLLFVPAVFRLVHERKPSRRCARAELPRRGHAHRVEDHLDAAAQFAEEPAEVGPTRRTIRKRTPRAMRKHAGRSSPGARSCSWRWRRSPSPILEYPDVGAMTKS